MGSLGEQLGMLSAALGEVLSSGIASGTDPAGLNFGVKYGRQAGEFATTLADAANAFKSVGYSLEATGFNYQNADAASTIGGSGASGGLGGEPSQTVAADVSLAPNGSMVAPPTKWSVIQPFLRFSPMGLFAGTALTWPSGNSAMMWLTGAQWRNIAAGLSVFESELGSVKSAVAAQMIPEAGAISAALDALGRSVQSLADTGKSLANTVKNFAFGVQSTQDAIRRLLDRLSLDGLLDAVGDVLSGDGVRLLREIADDVGDVLENFQQQIKGIVGLLDELATLIGDAATAFQEWIRPVLVAAFGDEVGGVLADAITVYTDFQVGVVTGLIGTVSGLVSMADPDTWKGMAELTISVLADPTKLPGVLENMGKQFVAWDKWSGEHPGRAAGEAAFNIGSLFVPGGALSKTGSVAKGLKITKELLGDGGKLGKLPNAAELPKLEGVGGLDGFGKTPEIPSINPGASSLLGHDKPPRLDSPVGAPAGRAGEPSPVVTTGEKASTPGASGGHGERAPVGIGPRSEASPSPSMSTADTDRAGHGGDGSRGPASSAPVHSQSSESSSGSQTPAGGNAVPEPASPTGTPDRGGVTSGNGQAPTTHESSTHGNGDQGHVTAGGPDTESREHRSWSSPEDGHGRAHDHQQFDDGDDHRDHDGPGDDARGPDGRIKLSGHGNYYPEDGYTVVPANTWFTVYAEHGSPISNSLGNLIESGGDTSMVYSHRYGPGDMVPNYTLAPPGDLTAVGTPYQVERPTLISDLLREDMGHVDFAACLGEGDKLYDLGGIYNREDNSTIHKYLAPEIDENDDW